MPSGVVTRYIPCQGDVHGAMTAVPGHEGHRSLNYDITRLTKCLQEKHTGLHWTVEALYMNSC